jgi:hypothetical protein
MATRTYEYQSNFARRYYTEGRTEGRAEGIAMAVLEILRARGIPVPDDLQTRITTCTDLHQLGTWIQQAATATTIHDLLDA